MGPVVLNLPNEQLEVMATGLRHHRDEKQSPVIPGDLAAVEATVTLRQHAATPSRPSTASRSTGTPPGWSAS